TGLSPATPYTFNVWEAGAIVETNSVTTLPSPASPPPSDIVFGGFSAPAPADGTIVYVTIDGYTTSFFAIAGATVYNMNTGWANVSGSVGVGDQVIVEYEAGAGGYFYNETDNVVNSDLMQDLGTYALGPPQPVGAVEALVMIEYMGEYLSVMTDANGNFMANLGAIGILPDGYQPSAGDGMSITIQGGWEGWNVSSFTTDPTSPQDLGNFPLRGPEPEIQLVKLANITAGTVNEQFKYDIFFNNTGFASSATFWLNDTLPTGITYVSDNASDTGILASSGVSGQQLWFNFTNVLAATDYMFAITVQATAGGVFTNWAFGNYTNSTGAEETKDNSTVTIGGSPGQPYIVMGFVLDPSPDGAWVNITIDPDGIPGNGDEVYGNTTADATGFYSATFLDTDDFFNGLLISGQANTTVTSATNTSTVDFNGVFSWLNFTLGTVVPPPMYIVMGYVESTSPDGAWVNITIDPDGVPGSGDELYGNTTADATGFYSVTFTDTDDLFTGLLISGAANDTAGLSTTNTSTVDLGGVFSWLNFTLGSAPPPAYTVMGYVLAALPDGAWVNITIDPDGIPANGDEVYGNTTASLVAPGYAFYSVTFNDTTGFFTGLLISGQATLLDSSFTLNTSTVDLGG
ncbi:MAG: DUF11 domain-containing protein, partial [Thermoplasmata archaeon]|nr:DUF11 domain-containing protein [Thermoplasmata archaeon]